MNITIQKLTEYFQKFPGIGPRQARRFVYFLLSKDQDFSENLSKYITRLKKEVAKCQDCQRFFHDHKQKGVCDICGGFNRDTSKLLVVEKDIDLENIEKSGTYAGHYFVLGGLVPNLGQELPKEVKMRKLFERVKKEATNGLTEIILAFNATPEGDNTGRYTEKILEPIISKTSIKISRFGRGLSTGTELEYSDSDTIKNALKNRK